MEEFDEELFDQFLHSYIRTNNKIKSKKLKNNSFELLERYSNETKKILSKQIPESTTTEVPPPSTMEEIPQPIEITNMEWLQQNKEIYETEQMLKEYQSFIQRKEEETLNEIISFSNPELSKKLFQNVITQFI
jgi:hypothetical protein